MRFFSCTAGVRFGKGACRRTIVRVAVPALGVSSSCTMVHLVALGEGEALRPKCLSPGVAKLAVLGVVPLLLDR